MWWSVHQPQCGSPELRHSPQVVYCSQDSTGTRDTCKGSKHTAQGSFSFFWLYEPGWTGF